ncbi:uncharacterized protein LOC115447071, partial [Manduca sexta]
MPPEMAVSMRRTKMKAEEVALIAGEITKPSWESRNEGIHERVSFEDTIWGFDLAGGSYYKTPLRVTFVKPGSRAERAGIRPGDRLLRINGVDTSTLTIQEAHDIIVKAGLYLHLNVTSPDDRSDAYYCYEDPIIDEYEAEQERLRAEEAARRRQVHAKVSSYWSLQWPWVSKRRIIWRESNCFMVPSKYEEKHKDKFLSREATRREDDIVLDRVKKPSDRATPPKFVRSKSYECTIEDNALEEMDDESKINGQENGNEEKSLQNGEVNDIDDSDIEENSVIENYEVDHIDNEVDDNNNVVETKEKDPTDSEVNIEEINEEEENVEQDAENKTEIQNVENIEESNDIKENGDIVNVHGNDEILEEILKADND